MVSGLASCFQATSVQVSNESRLELMAMEVLRWLNNCGGWLVIIDNLDDPRDTRGLLPFTQHGGHVLITTRNSDVKMIPAEGLQIPPMPEEEAAGLLRLLSNCGDEAVVDIVQELGMLPLAIDQAAAIIRHSNDRTFRDIFHSSVTKVLNEPPLLYPRSLFATWSIILDCLSSNAVELVQLIAFLNPDEVLMKTR